MGHELALFVISLRLPFCLIYGHQCLNCSYLREKPGTTVNNALRKTKVLNISFPYRCLIRA